MELFTLLAKLTLDSSEFESKIEDARSEAQSFDGDVDSSLDLDTSNFDTGLSGAEKKASAFTGPDEQTLDLDSSDFDTDLSDAATASEEFEGPEDPDLDIDTSGFVDNLDDAQTEADGFTGPDDPALDIDTSDFIDNLDDAQTESDGFTGPDSPSLDLDTSGFTGAMADTETSAGEFQTNLDGVWKKVATGITAAGIVGAINTIKNKIQEAVNLAAQLGDDADKGSRRLGISAKAYQEWGHALSQSGANINDFQRGILTINNLLAGNDISKDAAAAFDALGVSTKDANDNIKTTEKFLQDTVKALADFNGTNAERGALVQAIFGRSGNNLNALLDSGADGIDDLIKEANELGLVMSDKEVADSVAYGDALANMQDAVNALKTSLVTGIMPLLTDAMQQITAIVSVFNGRSAEDSLGDQLSGVDDALASTATDADATARTATGLLGKLWEMGDATKLTAEQSAVWHDTAKELIKLIPDLSDKINLDTNELSGNKEELQNVIDKWKEFTTVRALQSAMEKRQQLVADATEKQIDAQVDAIVKQTQAEVARQDAVKKTNELLSALGKDTLGENATEDEMRAAVQPLGLDYGYGSHVNEYNEAVGAIEDLSGTASAAEAAQQQADALSEELTKVKEENEAWEAAAKAAYFGTQEEADAAIASLAALNEEIGKLKEQSGITIDVTTSGGGEGASNAKGNWRVPYDNFPAILHRDEAVLTASDARKWREGGAGSGGVDLSSLAAAIVGAVRDGMNGASVNSFLDGESVTSRVNAKTSNKLKARRFAL